MFYYVFKYYTNIITILIILSNNFVYSSIIDNNDHLSELNHNQLTFKCDPFNCPLNQGICIENKCECFYEFTTIVNDQDKTEFEYCNYPKHLRATAFILEFFFPFGAGHFYIEKVKLGIFKLICFMIFFLFICGEFCYLSCKLNATNKCHLYLAFGIIFDIAIWLCFHLFDLICFGFGIYTDGNNIELI
jgi:hypothetical protein